MLLGGGEAGRDECNIQPKLVSRKSQAAGLFLLLSEMEYH